MLRLLVIDEQPMIREGIRSLVLRTPGLALSLEVDGMAALSSTQLQKGWDVAIIDPLSSGARWLSDLKLLCRCGVPRPVLVFTCAGREYSLNALRAGAAGVLDKISPLEEVVRAIQVVAARGRYLPSEIADALLEQITQPSDGLLHRTLSEREFEVFAGICKGRSTKEMAFALRLSAKTISTYRTRILFKLRVSSTFEVLKYSQLHNVFRPFSRPEDLTETAL